MRNRLMLYILLVIDDSASNDGFKNSKSIEKLFTIGRHFFISVIVIRQRIKSLSTTCRIITTYLIIGKLNSQSKNIYFSKYRKIQEMYRNAVKKIDFLIINSSGGNSDDLNSYYASIRVPYDKLKVYHFNIFLYCLNGIKDNSLIFLKISQS